MSSYIYKKPDGREIHCYGNIKDDSNFEIVHANEYYDAISGEIDSSKLNTWKKICDYLHKNHRKDIEQIVTC